MTVRRRKQASVGKLLLGYLGVLALIAYMSLVPGLWKMALFGLGLLVLGYLAVVYGYDSRDGKDW